MARTLTPQDAYALVNSLNAQLNGSANLTATNTASFVSVGELIMSAGMENVLNALSLIVGRTMVAVRPYTAKFRLINAINSGVFSNRIRKISFYSRDAQPAGFENTQLNPENLLEGVDNTGSSSSGHERTPSQWEQCPPVPLEMNFGGSDVYQSGLTIYQTQLQKAFRDEASFNEFVSGYMTAFGNDLESYKESLQKMLVCQYIAGVYDMNSTGSVVNLTSAYNSAFSTSYTTAQLLTTYADSFYKFFVETIQTYSDRLTYRTAKYHWAPTKSGYTFLRHTPKDRQKLFIYNPFMIRARTTVMPAIFNTEYLDINNYEGVDFWQAQNSPAGINITPAVIDTDTSHTTTYGTQIQGNAVSLAYVVAFMFDSDALMVDYQLDSALSTPVEARKKYSTIWHSVSSNYIADYTENAVLFYMADPTT